MSEPVLVNNLEIFAQSTDELDPSGQTLSGVSVHVTTQNIVLKALLKSAWRKEIDVWLKCGALEVEGRITELNENGEAMKAVLLPHALRYIEPKMP